MRYKILPFHSLRKNTAFKHTRRYISNWSSYEYNCLFHLTKCFTLSLADFASYFPRYCSVMKWKFKVKLSVIINTYTAVVFSNDIQTLRHGATMSRSNFDSMAILYFSTNLPVRYYPRTHFDVYSALYLHVWKIYKVYYNIIKFVYINTVELFSILRYLALQILD